MIIRDVAVLARYCGRCRCCCCCSPSPVQHEKIIRGLAMGLALISYGIEEAADTLIEQMAREQDPILRYGAMYVLGMAYRCVCVVLRGGSGGCGGRVCCGGGGCMWPLRLCAGHGIQVHVAYVWWAMTAVCVCVFAVVAMASGCYGAGAGIWTVLHFCWQPAPQHAETLLTASLHVCTCLPACLLPVVPPGAPPTTLRCSGCCTLPSATCRTTCAGLLCCAWALCS